MSHSTSQAEEEYNADPSPYNAVTMFCKGGICEKIKLVCSFVIVTLLILVVFTGISLNYCVLKVHPAIGFLIVRARAGLAASPPSPASP